MNAIDELLTRGVANIIPNKEELEKLLKSKKRLNIYLGIDPTATKIHLGHAVLLRLLQKFVDLGHRVTFLIGDFTALIGDTSDKDSERPVLTEEEIQNNFVSYKKQAKKILDFNKVQLKHNSEWLAKLSFKDIVKLCQNFSVGDFVGRELIKKRLAKGKKVGLHELLYPVMQGYDSYFMNTDIQIGGTDQTFNMQAGRVLMKNLRNKQSFVVTNDFLTGTDGRKMSKTWGNAIWLEDEPNKVYGKVMSLKDELIAEYFILATSISLKKVEQIKREIKRGKDLMSIKKRLAWQITMELHNAKMADSAQAEFERVHQRRNKPSEMMKFITTQIEWNPMDLLVEVNFANSKSVARRLIEQGGLKIDDEKFIDSNKSVKIKNGTVIQVGKMKFVKVVINKKEVKI